MAALLYVRLPDIPAAIEPDWTRWYDDVHMRYRFDKPGFLAARRYRATAGAHRHLALYELDSPAALLTPAYLAHRDWETAEPAGTFEHMGPRLPGFARGVYEQRSPAAAYAVTDAAALRVSGYDFPASDAADAFAAWCTREGVAQLQRSAGVVAARQMRLTAATLGARTGVATGKPRDLLVCDLAHDDAATRDALTAFDAVVASRFGRDGIEAGHVYADCVFRHRIAA